MQDGDDSKKVEKFFIKKSCLSKTECFDIPIKTPEKIIPGSEMEERYLKHLIRKYAKKEYQNVL